MTEPQLTNPLEGTPLGEALDGLRQQAAAALRKADEYAGQVIAERNAHATTKQQLADKEQQLADNEQAHQRELEQINEQHKAELQQQREQMQQVHEAKVKQATQDSIQAGRQQGEQAAQQALLDALASGNLKDLPLNIQNALLGLITQREDAAREAGREEVQQELQHTIDALTQQNQHLKQQVQERQAIIDAATNFARQSITHTQRAEQPTTEPEQPTSPDTDPDPPADPTPPPGEGEGGSEEVLPEDPIYTQLVLLGRSEDGTVADISEAIALLTQIPGQENPTKNGTTWRQLLESGALKSLQVVEYGKHFVIINYQKSYTVGGKDYLDMPSRAILSRTGPVFIADDYCVKDGVVLAMTDAFTREPKYPVVIDNQGIVKKSEIQCEELLKELGIYTFQKDGKAAIIAYRDGAFVDITPKDIGGFVFFRYYGGEYLVGRTDYGDVLVRISEGKARIALKASQNYKLYFGWSKKDRVSAELTFEGDSETKLSNLIFAHGLIEVDGVFHKVQLDVLSDLESATSIRIQGESLQYEIGGEVKELVAYKSSGSEEVLWTQPRKKIPEASDHDFQGCIADLDQMDEAQFDAFLLEQATLDPILTMILKLGGNLVNPDTLLKIVKGELNSRFVSPDLTEAVSIAKSQVLLKLISIYKEAKMQIPDRVESALAGLPDAVIPTGLHLLEVGTLHAHTAENFVRRLVHKVQGKDVVIYYKLDKRTARSFLYGRELKAQRQPSIEPKHYPILLQQERNMYRSAQLCFGDRHVARTEYQIGHDITNPDWPQIQVFQAPVGETLDTLMRGEVGSRSDYLTEEMLARHNGDAKSAFAEVYEAIKSKQYSELDPDKPYERMIIEAVRIHRKALQDFYPAYVESVLMGYVPDLQHWSQAKPLGYAGMLFNGNIGIGVDADGQEVVQLFDFGSPIEDRFPVQMREGLRRCIDEHRKAGELPIVEVNGVRQLEDWYEAAIRRLIIQFHGEYAFHTRDGMRRTIDEEVDSIRNNLGLGKNKDELREHERKNPIFRDLMSYQRLTGAPEYV